MKSAQIRREGFRGQHLAVLPAPVRQTALKHPLLRTLLVTDAGFFPQAAGHRVERPQGASTHLLIVCLRGRGWVRSGNCEQAVNAGDLVWLPANEAHTYGCSAENAWTIGWAHFCGDEVVTWQKQLGWATGQPFGLGHVPPHHLVDLKLDQVYAWLERGYALPQMIGAAVALRTFFCATLQFASTPGANRSAAERVAAVRDQLRETLARPYRLEELAAAANLSVPHFSELFRKQTGYAPIDFLIRQRIQRACLLLDTTGNAISAIATEVGYNDPYYFTRSFRRIMGSSPRAYRRIVKG